MGIDDQDALCPQIVRRSGTGARRVSGNRLKQEQREHQNKRTDAIEQVQALWKFCDFVRVDLAVRRK